MRNSGLDEEWAGIKIAERNINNLRYADDTTLMAENEEELKSLLMKVKEESEKTGIKLNIQNMKIMASCPITSWQIDGATMEAVTDFILGSSKITADGNCSHEIKRCLLLGRKAMTNLDSVLKTETEQDGGEVGRRGVHLSLWIHQECSFRHTEVHAEHQLRPYRSTWPAEKNI